MPQTKPVISVENVVASATVDQKIDLNDLTKKFPDTEYHPDQFPGLVFLYILLKDISYTYNHCR
jgi:transcription initiation factor TFIID TATA-box-binding protein